MLGGALIAVSLWGIKPCHKLFRGFLPDTSSADVGFADLASWIAWLLYFGPVLTAGIAIAWMTLKRLGVLDKSISWVSKRLFGGDGTWKIAREAQLAYPRRLETLDPATAARLQRRGAQAAIVIGAFIAISLIAFGTLGLAFLLLSRTATSNSVWESLALSRLTIGFAVLCGTSVFLGTMLLLRTFRREDSSWLLLLGIFNRVIPARCRIARGTQRETPGSLELG